MTKREEMARLIDPEAWMPERYNELVDWYGGRPHIAKARFEGDQDKSLEIADSLIAAGYRKGE